MAWNGMTSSPSTSLGFSWVRIMNSSGYHEMKKFPKEKDILVNQKIHAHNHLKSARVPFDHGSRKRSPVQRRPLLSQWRSIEAAGNGRKLLVHADNARQHTAMGPIQYLTQNRMKSAPHPPYSPDLAPSDFYLFGNVKRCLTGLSFDDADQLLAAGEGFLEGTEK
jgi:hypothetical protein